MYRTRFPLALMGFFGLFAAAAQAGQIAELTAENYSQMVPQGKEVDAIYGDFVLRNDLIVAVVAQPTAWRNANMTVKGVAGAVIDLTKRDRQSDQLSAFYPESRQFDYRQATIQTASGETVSLKLTAAATENRPAAELTYQLEDGQTWITVTTRLHNTSDKPLTVALRDEVRADNTFDKSPNGPAPLWWADDNYFAQAYALLSDSLPLASNNDGRNTRIAYLTEADEQVTLKPGEERTLSRKLITAAHRVEAWSTARRLRGNEDAAVELSVVDAAGAAVAGAWVRIGPKGFRQGVARTDDAGRVTLPLEAGEHALAVEAVGHGPAITEPLVVSSDAQHKITLPSPGRVVASIVDGAGQPIACKVEFVGTGPTDSPNFGHDSEAYGVRNLRYTPDGRFDQKIDPGQYDVIVSHGSEYDAYFGQITVSGGEATPLEVSLPRTVETPGWVSTDFHSHASPSGDNTASQLGRVLNLVAEHIEYAPCTEHNRIDTYLPHYDTLDIHGRMATASGIELTGSPLPINHQNAFPLKMQRGVQDQGAPQTLDSPVAQIGRLALWDARSEKLVQQNHPDLGWMYNDADQDGRPDEGYRGMIEFQDTIEVHRTNGLLEMQPTYERGDRVYNNVAFNWLQFLNQGIRTPIVHNTDAHYNYHGSGGIRNYVRSSTDDPAKIDTLEIVRECEAGHIILTNGPYLEVSATAGDQQGIAGDDLPAPDGRVEIAVRVQCPNWLDIDRVQVLVNGRIHEEYNFTRQKESTGFSDGVVKFERSIPVQLDSDAHLVVVAVHSERYVGPVMGPTWGGEKIGACANPIYIDVDGGGFKPNGDTLDHPLPAAGGKPKP